jgi:peptide/nickel transport system substrate-binding protein
MDDTMGPSFARPSVSLLTAIVLTLAACQPKPNSQAGGSGSVIIATGADADALVPPIVRGLTGKQIIDQIFDYLADPPATLNTVGDAGFTPRLARSWTWSKDSLAITFALNPSARWHDGRPVRAGDVRFTFDLLKDPLTASAIASSLKSVDSISVTDSLTATAWFNRRTPEQFFDLVYNVAVLPEHLLATVPRDRLAESPFAVHPIGSGRFRFSSWERGALVELIADTANYRGRPKLDRVVWSVVPDPTALIVKVLREEGDFMEVVRGDGIKQVQESQVAKLVGYPSLDYGYVGFNFRERGSRTRPHRLFRDSTLRRALSMAIDRRSVVRSVVDTLGYVGIGPVVRAQASADTTLAMPPFDPAAARALLDSLGWRDANGDGIRERGNVKLEFDLSVPSSSAIRRQMAVLLQSQWHDVGANARLDVLEPVAFFERLGKGQFDAMINAWHTDPSPAGAEQTWGSRGGSNFTGYASAAFDAQLDSAAVEFDPARSRTHYRRAYQTIVDDFAAVWLFEARYAAAAHKRLTIRGIRADAWWAGLPEWTIAPEQRLARDRVGLGTVAVRTP